MLTHGEHPSRRAVIGNVAGATVLGSLLSVVGTAPATVNAKGVSDTDILNFALNLEYLEAEFYNYAVNGRGIGALGVDLRGTGTSGSTVGGSKVALNDPLMAATAQQLAYDELTHVNFAA